MRRAEFDAVYAGRKKLKGLDNNLIGRAGEHKFG